MLPTIEFAHANGFGALTYSYFLEQLAPHPLSYIPKLGHNGFLVDASWHDLSNELISHIKSTHQQPIVGVGHSLGGVITLLAALRQPELFRQIILLDPPLFRAFKRSVIGMIRLLNLSSYFSPANKAKNRRTQFASRVEAYDYFKEKALFKSFHKQCLQDYVQYGLKENTEGFELDFSAAVEYAVFCNAPGQIPHTNLKVPAHFIYSTKGVLDAKDLAWHQKTFPQINYIEFENGGHLFPQEQPHRAAELIKSLIVR